MKIFGKIEIKKKVDFSVGDTLRQLERRPLNWVRVTNILHTAWTRILMCACVQ